MSQHLLMSGASFVTIACLMVLSVGCAPIQTVTTTVVLRDPSAVALLSPSGDLLVAPVAGVADAPLARGRADTGPGSSAAFEVHARREPDQSTTVEWSSSLPLGNGDRHTVVPANGALSLDQPLDSMVPLRSRTAPSLRFQWCTSITQRFSRGGPGAYWVDPHACTNPTYVAFPTQPAIVAPYILDTPWSNVVEIRERTTVDHATGWAIFGVFTGLFGSLSAVAFAVPHSTGVKLGLGIPLATLGLAVDVSVLPTLFSPSHDVVIRH
jgi:hypothetical protein